MVRPTVNASPVERSVWSKINITGSTNAQTEIAKYLTPPGGKVIWAAKSPSLGLEAFLIRLSAQKDFYTQFDALVDQLSVTDSDPKRSISSATYNLDALPSGHHARWTHLLKQYPEMDAPLIYESYWLSAVDTGAEAYLLNFYQSMPRTNFLKHKFFDVDAPATRSVLDLGPMLRKMIRSIVAH